MGAPGAPALSCERVREALEALYDSASLGACTLARYYPEVTAIPGTVERAQALRSLLLDAIEALRPLQSTADSIQAARDYDVLSLRYASGLSVEQVAEQLCVGARQVYRDLRRAEEKLCDILADRRLAAPLAGLAGGRLTRKLETPPAHQSGQTLDARELVAAAVKAVQPLAQARGIAIAYEPPPALVLARGMPGMLRTALIQLLSAAVQASASEAVRVVLSHVEGEPLVSIEVHLPPGPGADALADALPAARLANLDCRLRQVAAGRWQALLRLPRPRARRILVIEDNVGASELYERYLEGSDWQVVCSTEATSAVEVARAQRPSAIILDIMMPELDGWTVLQDLRLEPDTASIPVIICSVVHDPGLAAALGAAGCLAKPVARLRLLAALKQVLGADS